MPADRQPISTRNPIYPSASATFKRLAVPEASLAVAVVAQVPEKGENVLSPRGGLPNRYSQETGEIGTFGGGHVIFQVAMVATSCRCFGSTAGRSDPVENLRSPADGTAARSHVQAARFFFNLTTPSLETSPSPLPPPWCGLVRSTWCDV